MEICAGHGCLRKQHVRPGVGRHRGALDGEGDMWDEKGNISQDQQWYSLQIVGSLHSVGFNPG